MTTQLNALKHLNKAKALLVLASAEIQEALGETDVGTEYEREFEQLLEELESDIADIAAGEVYEFRS